MSQNHKSQPTRRTPSAYWRSGLLNLSRRLRRHLRPRQPPEPPQTPQITSETVQELPSVNLGSGRESVEEAVDSLFTAVSTQFDKQKEDGAEMTEEQSLQKMWGVDVDADIKSAEAILQFVDDNDSIGGSTQADSSEQRRLRRHFDPDESGGGGRFCDCGKTYHVAHELADGDSFAQSRFIQKVFAIILVKASVILIYLCMVELLEEFQTFYKQSYHYHYASAGVYVLIKIIIRLTKNCRRRNCCLHIILHLMDIVALSDFLACSMVHWLTDYVYFSVPRKILFSLAGTSIYFIFVGWFVAYDMTDGIMMASALIITCLTALHQVLHGTIRGTGFEPNMGTIKEEWSCVLIVLGVAEIIMMIMMHELKSVLTGHRFSVWYTDWFFTGVYII